jgi:DNA-binding GntR family transcriptional regulator
MIEIVKAIEERDGEKACSLMQEHVARGCSYMEKAALGNGSQIP